MTSFIPISTFFISTLVFYFSCSNSEDTNKPTASVQKDTSLNGVYKGLEYMGISTDPAYPDKKFTLYHLGYLKIKGDSVYLDQSPIFVCKNDTSYSVSDGGFYYYSGTLQKNDSIALFDLKELFCDYCGNPVRNNPDGTKEIIKRAKQLKGRLTDKGFIIDKYLYAKTTTKKDLTSEHPESFLKSQ